MSVNVSVICNELILFFGPAPAVYSMNREENRLLGALKTIMMNARDGELETEEEDVPYLDHEEVSDPDWKPEDETAKEMIESTNGHIKFSTKTVPVEQVYIIFCMSTSNFGSSFTQEYLGTSCC